MGIIFMSFSEAVREHPELVKKYLGSVVPHTDNFFAALNSAVFSDGSFVYIPKGVRCPMELSTYFRINAKDTGQFERTLIIADEGSFVSYLEGCTAPMRDENQLHAAVVELVAHDDATIKYSTIQNWYPGDKDGKGGIYNFVTKRGLCEGRGSKITWTQVETGSAITWKYPSCILKGDNSIGEFYSVATTNNWQQADTGTKMIHVGKNTRSTIVSKGISAGHGQNTYRGQVRIGKNATNGAQLFAVRLAAHRRQVRRAHVPVSRHPQQHREGRARGVDVEDRRGPDFLLPAARADRRGCRQHDRQRLLQGSVPGAADGVRGRSTEAAERLARRVGWINMLDIKNLQVRAENKEILKGINLRVNAGEVHAIMGPNGSGKSTLARALSGHPEYHVTGGEVLFEGRDLLDMDPDERAREGVFMAFQYPVEIAGVNNAYFLKAALNAKRKHHGEPELDAMEFMALIKSKSSLLDIDQSMLSRAVNEGFSGGEKKRNEIFQMALLEPKLAILDETDSGLDIDALKLVATGVNAMRGPERAFIVVTHYQRLLDYIVPDHVHVLSGGRIVRSGGKELALELEKKGYGWIETSAQPVGA